MALSLKLDIYVSFGVGWSTGQFFRQKDVGFDFPPELVYIVLRELDGESA
jgi:hypothetical protein